jgi:hypothetical protein
MDRGPRSFPTAAGWCFARPAVAHECGSRHSRVPGAAQHIKGVHARLRGPWWCAADTDLGFTRDRRLKVASRVNPTCVDRSSLWRSRISGTMARRRRPSTRLWLHFVTRCTASGTRDSVGRVRSLIHFSNSPSRSRGAFASGSCIFASLTPNEGWAERRETFGCSAEHPWGTP